MSAEITHAQLWTRIQQINERVSGENWFSKVRFSKHWYPFLSVVALAELEINLVTSKQRAQDPSYKPLIDPVSGYKPFQILPAWNIVCRKKLYLAFDTGSGKSASFLLIWDVLRRMEHPLLTPQTRPRKCVILCPAGLKDQWKLVLMKRGYSTPQEAAMIQIESMDTLRREDNLYNEAAIEKMCGTADMPVCVMLDEAHSYVSRHPLTETEEAMQQSKRGKKGQQDKQIGVRIMTACEQKAAWSVFGSATPMRNSCSDFEGAMRILKQGQEYPPKGECVDFLTRAEFDRCNIHYFAFSDRDPQMPLMRYTPHVFTLTEAQEQEFQQRLEAVTEARRKKAEAKGKATVERKVKDDGSSSGAGDPYNTLQRQLILKYKVQPVLDILKRSFDKQSKDPLRPWRTIIYVQFISAGILDLFARFRKAFPESNSRFMPIILAGDNEDEFEELDEEAESAHQSAQAEYKSLQKESKGPAGVKAVAAKYNSTKNDFVIDAKTGKKQAVFKYLIMTKRGEKGIDLVLTDEIVIMSTDWNRATYKQVIGRGRRIGSHIIKPGQPQPVIDIHDLVCVFPHEKTAMQDSEQDFIKKIATTEKATQFHTWLQHEREHLSQTWDSSWEQPVPQLNTTTTMVVAATQAEADEDNKVLNALPPHLRMWEIIESMSAFYRLAAIYSANEDVVARIYELLKNFYSSVGAQYKRKQREIVDESKNPLLRQAVQKWSEQHRKDWFEIVFDPEMQPFFLSGGGAGDQEEFGNLALYPNVLVNMIHAMAVKINFRVAPSAIFNWFKGDSSKIEKKEGRSADLSLWILSNNKQKDINYVLNLFEHSNALAQLECACTYQGDDALFQVMEFKSRVKQTQSLKEQLDELQQNIALATAKPSTSDLEQIKAVEQEQEEGEQKEGKVASSGASLKRKEQNAPTRSNLSLSVSRAPPKQAKVQSPPEPERIEIDD